MDKIMSYHNKINQFKGSHTKLSRIFLMFHLDLLKLKLRFQVAKICT